MAERLPELLAPAGGYRALLAAVAAGADAVYVGLSRFSARVSAEGFDLEMLERGAALAHVRGVRVYVAMNIALHDDELDDACALAARTLDAGADALIVADLGFIARLRRELPAAELHLSTQAGAHAPEALELAARELGVERVTVARELPLGEIAALCRGPVPIECFVHGAICIGYSGACAFSALRRGRSALRGDCTQPCRMSYGLEDADGNDVARVAGDKLLCPRDYLGIAHIDELVRAGVASLKIEGRMKNPDYVFNVVRTYRRALNAFTAGEEVDAPALTRELGRSFNRGFTSAYLEGRSGAELMSFERSINQGVRVGRVVAVRRGECDVLLDAAVSTGDTLEIRFYPGEDALPDVPKRWPQVPCPRDAETGETLAVRCKRKISVGCEVYLIRSTRVLAETASALDEMGELASKIESSGIEPACGGGRRCVPAVAREQALHGAQRSFGNTETAEPVDLALNRNDIGKAAALNEAESTVVGDRTMADDTSQSLDAESKHGACYGAASVFAPVKNAPTNDAVTHGGPTPAKPVACVDVVATPAAARELLAAGREVAACAWQVNDDPAWDPLLPELTILLDEVLRPDNRAETERLLRVCKRAVCRNIGQIPLARAVGRPLDVGAPVFCTNAQTAVELARLGAARIWLIDELSDPDVAALAGQLAASGASTELVRARQAEQQLMVSEHCILTAEGPCSGACATCARRKQDRYLVERDGTRLPVRSDSHGRSRIFAGAGRATCI